MKNLVIFVRVVLERKPCGYFQPRTEYKVLKDFTPKQKEEFIKEINKNKRNTFEVLAEYDFKKVRDRDRFLIDCIKCKKIELYQSYYQNILDTIK